MRVSDSGDGGNGAIAAGSTGTIRVVSSASEDFWAVNVPFRPSSANSTTSRLAFFRDDVGPGVAAAAAGYSAAHLRHPPFRSGI